MEIDIFSLDIYQLNTTSILFVIKLETVLKLFRNYKLVK